MTYVVKEIFHTLQGEGINAGRVAVFCRFAGCNLWSGREQDRHQSACPFCDTAFVGTDGEGGGKFPSPQRLAEAIATCWREGTCPGAEVGCGASPPGFAAEATRDPVRARPGRDRVGAPLVVLTGGEPMLQVDEPLIQALHARGFEVALETNGTLPVPASIDWVCVSPKAGTEWVQFTGHELKLVFPQPGLPPLLVQDMAALQFHYWLLQPMDGPSVEEHTRAAVAFCRTHPRWRLSLQLHKRLGIP